MLKLELADRVIAAAIATARGAGMKPLAVAVIDAGGHPVGFSREDGATALRHDIAMAKAWTALNLGQPSRGFAAIAEQRPHFAASLGAISDGRMTPAAGGILLEVADAVIGAVGVSGDTPDNDELAALAGAASIGQGAAVTRAAEQSAA